MLRKYSRRWAGTPDPGSMGSLVGVAALESDVRKPLTSRSLDPWLGQRCQGTKLTDKVAVWPCAQGSRAAGGGDLVTSTV